MSTAPGGKLMNPILENWVRLETRRQFLSHGANALGWAALSALAANQALAEPASNPQSAGPKGLGFLPDRNPQSRPPHFPAKAKHVIYLHMVGGPPQMD